MTNNAPTVIPGSSKPPVTGAARVADVAPDETVEVTLTLRGPALPSEEEIARGAVDPDRFAADYAAGSADVDTVTRTLADRGLTVVDASPATRSVRVAGPAGAIADTFGVDLGLYRVERAGRAAREYRGQEGHVSVPAGLEDVVTGVFGLDLRQVAHRRTAASHAPTRPALTPAQLEERYAFPDGDASGRTVALAEFAGFVNDPDLRAFCEKYDLPDATTTTTAISVGYPVLTLDDVRQLSDEEQQEILGAATEVMMDVEIVAALAPGATMNVYFAPFTQKGWVDLLNRVILDRPVALSVSWGSSEDEAEAFSAAAKKAIGERLAAAAALGITVCVSAGDDGSGDNVRDGHCHVDFPAASPFVLAVGGTEIDDAGDEVVWWDKPGTRFDDQWNPTGGGATGGGISSSEPRPSWQDVAVTRVGGGPEFDGRVVPDVAALSGRPFYDLVFLGKDAPNGGTSASAPLWASLVARAAAAKGADYTSRFLTPLLYQGTNGTTACRDITGARDNASSPHPGVGYAPQEGYDAVTGWGVPIGTAVVSILP